MDLAQFNGLQLPQDFVLLGVKFVEAPMCDAIVRPALAKAVIEGNTISMDLAYNQSPEELSVSLYHELREAMTVGVVSPPRMVCDLNEAGFEQAAKDSHREHGLASARSVLMFLREFGFTE